LRLLLDTHVIIWALEEPARFRADTRAALENPANDLYVSVVSPWEIAIKHAKGQLAPPPDLLEELRRQSFAELRVSWEHGLAAGALPLHHRDPFDRMLVAQAQSEGLTIVTDDPKIALYDVKVMRG
jgi:PIN domain nuclease of toxin-antitoxin system